MKNKKLNYPNDGGLKKQVREFQDTTSAFSVLEKHFFPERFDENGNRKVLTTDKK